MHILLFSSVYPQPGDPARGIYCRNLLKAVVNPAHQVRVVAPYPWTARLGHAFGRGARAEKSGDPGPETDHPTFYDPPCILKRMHGRLMWASARGAIRRVIRDGFRPDCVLSYWTYPDGEAARRAGDELGVPVALIVGGSDVLLLGRQPLAHRRLFIDVLKSVDEVQVVSSDLRSHVIGLGIDPDRVHESFQGVDLVRFSPGDRREARLRLGLPVDVPTLVWVGRMVPVKALDVLLRACAGLQTLGVPFRLCLVGDGPLRKPMEALALELGLEDLVTFTGACPQDELPDWYRAGDLAVLSSLSEGIPDVLREAQACGRPFVATRVGGIPEISDPATSRLVEPGSPSALTGAIRELLGSQPARRAGRRRRFSAGLVGGVGDLPRQPTGGHDRIGQIAICKLPSRGRPSRTMSDPKLDSPRRSSGGPGLMPTRFAR